MKLIPEFLAGIRYLVRRAEELKIRDRLVIVVQSEMGRTPTYNSGNGKDHWSIGSIMFLGRGIRGNRVIGATDEKQFHVPLNPQTLACDRQNGIRVRPEHIHTALREFAGIADHPFSRKFPLGVADKERLRRTLGLISRIRRCPDPPPGAVANRRPRTAKLDLQEKYDSQRRAESFNHCQPWIVDNDELLHRPDLPLEVQQDLAAQGSRRAERWVIVAVEEAYIHCSKHIPLLGKRDKKAPRGTDAAPGPKRHFRSPAGS